MEQTDYEYRGLIVSSWDLLRGDTSNWPDRFFYKDVILHSGQPALDVGCGTGRLLLDYLASGIDIDGVDNSPEMLALCREKAQKLDLQPTLFQQAMELLNLPRKYRTIIVPSSSFQLVTNLNDAAEAMKRFLNHLEPGGVVVMPFMILWTGQATENIITKDWRLVAERIRPNDDVLVRRWTCATYDIANQLEHTEDRYEVIREGEVIASEYHSRSPATRWYTQEQAIDLFREASFTNIQLVSGFSQQPVSEGDTLFSVFGTRP
ncbi:MAG: class I SAM-dependent methyltransferase [Candidatus Tectomicrobia bacterium]|nr:class I SAM-dependent methyltransferase [Candidatus Tectomicrobia bacterium]